MPVTLCLDLLLVVLVVAAAASDLATRRIPNRLLAAAWLLALPLHALSPAPAAALAASLAGAALGLLLFLPLYLARGMAAGDVKLMATVGAITGPGAAVAIALLAWCAGGVMALVMLAARGRLRDGFASLVQLLRPLMMRAAGLPAATEPAAPGVGAMPYGVAVAIAALYSLWAGRA